MKTIIKIQETGNRKYKKVMVKVFAFSLALLIGSTVTSQNSFETGKSTNAMVQRMDVSMEQPDQDSALLASVHPSIKVNRSLTAIEISSFKIEPTTEKSLEIEGWMTDLRYFGQIAYFADEKEKPLELEEWMTNELNFGPTALTAEKEPAMKVEFWMLSEVFWKK